MMMAAVVAGFFKYKVVGSVFILACWPLTEKSKFIRELSDYGVKATFSSSLDVLENVNHQLQGVLYIYCEAENSLLDKMNINNFANWYKWLIIGDEIPQALNNIRYDADITLVNLKLDKSAASVTNVTEINDDTGEESDEFSTNSNDEVEMSYKDVYIHMRDKTTLHEWATWTTANGLQLKYENERLLRRRNLEQYPLRISTPTGHFTDSGYNGTFEEYLLDSNTRPDLDSSIRCPYSAAALMAEALNASYILNATLIWATVTDNRSMLITVAEGRAELGGAILRPLHYRMKLLDFVMPLWPFRVGFTYLAERESSGNMFVEPFSVGVWWSCLVTGLILALVQRLTARMPVEKDGAVDAVLATFLQQDASAVPEGLSGRWTFTILSLWAMLLHAYYTSAIVSALMSAGRSGPDTLRTLADSKYAIASEDYDYMRLNMFDRDSNSTELEYLKKKKMTRDLYQPTQRGVELILGENTAYHSEYNQLYRHLNGLNDDQVCKLSYIDTIPETITWIVATKRSQFTDALRTTSARIHETGLAKRLISKWLIKPSPCRASLLAERVKFGDVALLLGVTALGAVLSFSLLALEIGFHKFAKKRMERERSALSIWNPDFVED